MNRENSSHTSKVASSKTADPSYKQGPVFTIIIASASRSSDAKISSKLFDP